MSNRFIRGVTTAAWLSAAPIAWFDGAYLRADDPPGKSSPGVAVRLDGLADRQMELAKRISAAPQRMMKGSGIVGVMGGVHVKVTAGDWQEVHAPEMSQAAQYGEQPDWQVGPYMSGCEQFVHAPVVLSHAPQRGLQGWQVGP